MPKELRKELRREGEYYVPKRRYNMNGTGSPYKTAKDPWKLLINRAKGNAKPGQLKGNGIARTEALEVNITVDSLKEQFLKQEGRCYWSGFPINMEGIRERKNPLAPSLDRLDDTKGYTRDNVVLTIRLFNLGRQTCPADKFRGICDLIKAHYRGEKVRNTVTDFIDPDPNKLLIEEMKIDMNDIFDQIYEGKGPDDLQEKFDDLFITHEGERPLKDAIQKRREEQGISEGVGKETR